jgi:hypothetical protein
MRTKQQIEEEVERLKSMKTRVIHYTITGEDNHAAMEAQIEVLQKRMTQEDVDLAFGDPFDDEESNIYANAQQAYNWMVEDDESLPSFKWAELVIGSGSTAH